MINQPADRATNKIAVVQMNSGDDVNANLKQAERLITLAVQKGAGLIVLPETFAFIGKTNKQQTEIAEPIGNGRIQDFLAQQAVTHQIWIVGGTVPITSPVKDRIYAACILYDTHGKQTARYDKIHLFDVSIPERNEQYSESETFYPGNRIVVADTPFGQLGLAVCYDIRFPEMFRLLIDQGAEIIAVPAAFTAATGAAHWYALLKARAVENLIYIAAAGQVGTHNNLRETYGHSMIIEPWGEIQASLDYETGAEVAVVDTEMQHKLRKNFPCLSHRVFKVNI